MKKILPAILFCGAVQACGHPEDIPQGTANFGQLMASVYSFGAIALPNTQQQAQQEANQRIAQQEAAQRAERAAQVAPIDPVSRSVAEADRRFCTDERIRTSPFSCSMFREQSRNCMLLGGYAYSARLTYLMWKREGMTNSQAIRLASRNMDIAELAGSAPESTTPDEFRLAVVRLAVVQSCLDRAAE
jgi:hypothetical protein